MVQYECGEQYIFDLDSPVHLRYNKLFPKYTPLIRQYCELWKKQTQISEEELKVFDKIGENHPDLELIEDCQYFSQVCEIPFNLMLYTQYMYDFSGAKTKSMGCTSILVSPKNAKPYLIRNLDWDFNDLIQALTITAVYTRKGEIVMTQLAIVGQLSVAHTIKSQNLCISVNFLMPEFTKQELFDNIKKNPGIPSLVRLLRLLLQDNPNFETVRDRLVNSRVQHHGFLNVVGQQRNEICIFHIKDFSNCNKFQSETYLDENQNYILSTNGDYTNNSLFRYEQAMVNMSNLSAAQLEISDNVVNLVARKYPNNNNETIYTAVLKCDKEYEIIL